MTRLEQALAFTENGISVFALPENSKRPLQSWKRWQNEIASEDQCEDWFAGTERNIAVVTGKLSDLDVIDFDSDTLAREFFKQHQSLCKVIVKTRRGVHFAFRHSGLRNTQGTPDVRGEGGYVCWPSSKVDGHTYHFIDGFSDLTKRVVLPEGILPSPAKVEKVTANAMCIKSYIAKIFAVSGERGSAATFRACCKLRDAGLSEAEALGAMIEWNETNASPRWTLAELIHKTKDAYSK